MIEASDRKLKVAQIITSVVLGGGGQVMSSLARNIDRSRFEMDIYCIIKGGEFIDDIRHLGFPVHVLQVYDSRRRLRYDMRAWMSLVTLIRRGHYDVVHTHLYRADVIGRIAAILAGKPALVKTLHNMGTWKRLPQRLTDFALNTFTNRIVCVSESQKSLALKQEWVSPAKVQVIPNGVDVSRFDCRVDRESLAHSLGIDPDGLIIGTVGRLIDEKGHRYLLQAVPEIQRRFPRSQFLIVGDGPLRASLEDQIARLGLRDVFITGLRKDVPQLMSIMDVYVFPSLSEAFGIAMLEAMAARKPVACADIPALAEIVRKCETAVVFRQRDAASLAEQVCELLGDAALSNTIASAAYLDVINRFSEAAMARAYERLYVELAQGKSRLA